MNIPTVREELIVILFNELSDDEAASVLEYAKSLKTNQPGEFLIPEDDPLVGFISGPTDWAERTEDILYDDISSRSG